MKKLSLLLVLLAAILVGCKKKGCTDSNATNYNANANSDDGSCTYPAETETGPYLIVKLHFDSLAPRLDNFGNPATIPSDHWAQSPVFYGMSAHYIEFAQSMYTALGAVKFYTTVQKQLQVVPMLLISVKQSLKETMRYS